MSGETDPDGGKVHDGHSYQVAAEGRTTQRGMTHHCHYHDVTERTEQQQDRAEDYP